MRCGGGTLASPCSGHPHAPAPRHIGESSHKRELTGSGRPQARPSFKEETISLCHPERSEGSHAGQRSFATLRMTLLNRSCLTRKLSSLKYFDRKGLPRLSHPDCLPFLYPSYPCYNISHSSPNYGLSCPKVQLTETSLPPILLSVSDYSHTLRGENMAGETRQKILFCEERSDQSTG